MRWLLAHPRRIWHCCLALALAGAGIAVVSCGSLESSTECETACKGLTHCGLLPSALGATTGDYTPMSTCIDRCQLSSENELVASCFQRDMADDQDATTLWCGQDAVCAKAAECIRDIPSTSPLLATVVSRVFAVAGAEGGVPPAADDPTCTNGAACASCVSAGACDLCGGKTFTLADATAWCASAGIAEFVPFVEVGATFRPGDAVPCVEMLTQPFNFVGLTPDVVRVGIEIRSMTPALDGGAANADAVCRVFLGLRVVAASSQVDIPTRLPPASALAMDGGFASWTFPECVHDAVCTKFCTAPAPASCDAAADGGCSDAN